MIDIAVDLTNMPAAAPYQQASLAVEVLRLLEIGEDIILFINEGEIESSGPKGDIDERVFCRVRVIVEVIDPGTFAVLHRADQVIDRGGIVAVFF